MLNFISFAALFGMITILFAFIIPISIAFKASRILLRILFLTMAEPSFLLVIMPYFGPLLLKHNMVPADPRILFPACIICLNSFSFFILFKPLRIFCPFFFFLKELFFRRSFLIWLKIRAFFFCFFYEADMSVLYSCFHYNLIAFCCQLNNIIKSHFSNFISYIYLLWSRQSNFLERFGKINISDKIRDLGFYLIIINNLNPLAFLSTVWYYIRTGYYSNLLIVVDKSVDNRPYLLISGEKLCKMMWISTVCGINCCPK